MMVRTRPENQLSREREKLTVAPIATSRAGNAAMIEKRATMRMWNRAPGIFSRQALSRPETCVAMMAMTAMIRTTLKNSATRTTLLEGTIGVRPVRIRKVMSADSSDSPTVHRPMKNIRSLGSRSGCSWSSRPRGDAVPAAVDIGVLRVVLRCTGALCENPIANVSCTISRGAGSHATVERGHNTNRAFRGKFATFLPSLDRVSLPNCGKLVAGVT